MTSLADAQAEVRERRLRLTDHWTELKPHPIQALYYWHPARFKVNPSGRRSGKSELSKRKKVLQLVQLNKRGKARKVFAGAPSYGQARDIFWGDFQKLIPDHWKKKVYEYPRMEIHTHWGSMLKVFGLDRPRRIEGVPWDDALVDEIADCPPQCFALNIRPALSTLGQEGTCDLIGVPDEVGRNQAEYEQLWEIGLGWHPDLARARDPDICSFHWRSSDILDPKEVAAAMRSMDHLAFEQEYGGRFVTSGGKALPRFDTALHVDADMCDYEPRLPLDWSLDFGVNPAASLICQTYKRHIWVLDELVLADSSTDVAAAAFLERCSHRNLSTRFIRVYGDAAGNSRHSNVGKTDYEILENALRSYNVEWNQLTAAPAIKDTLNSVRSGVCSADNVIHLHVHPRCTTLIKDMKTAPWPSDLREFHALAALRYYAYRILGSDPGIAVTGISMPNLTAQAEKRRTS